MAASAIMAELRVVIKIIQTETPKTFTLGPLQSFPTPEQEHD